MAQHPWSSQVAKGDGHAQNIEQILKANIPGAISVERGSRSEDRQGIDYWVKRCRAHPLAVDVKVCLHDYQADGYDDVALETWSVIEKEKVGWTRDSEKRTDYILWYWPNTVRYFLVPFPVLCKVFQARWQEWRECYRVEKQESDSWHSECIYVPRQVVSDAMLAWMSGYLPF